MPAPTSNPIATPKATDPTGRFATVGAKGRSRGGLANLLKRFDSADFPAYAIGRNSRVW
jgi:hypothetical protein